MKYLLDFFHQSVPKGGTDMPDYYHSALMLNETLLTVYFFACVPLFYWQTKQWEYFPVLMFVLMLAFLLNNQNMSMRLNIGAYSLITIVWCGWFIYQFGWNCGGQHLMIPLLAMIFFNIFDPPWMKIVNCAGLIIFRIVLYVWTQNHLAIVSLSSSTEMVYQIINSVLFFIMMAADFIIFSSSVQDTERELRINNQELHKEAETDPLTQLPNRRAMRDMMDSYIAASSRKPYCVAIADIDLFKNINDTYGHNCGDYTLVQLADLFERMSNKNYTVCRWGGEEFCFFLPGKNLDDTWYTMFDICEAVRKMPLNFEGNEFHITITIGIEENDYKSSIDKIIEKADKKLYMGKISGRNQVVR